MYKWLTIMGIVCLGFIIVLLSLGYLLKENEVATTALKKKLDQQKLSSAESSATKAQLTFVDPEQNDRDKLERYKNIIIENLTCTETKQCVLVNTNNVSLNCIVAVNRIGASVLAKELKKDQTIRAERCMEKPQNLISVCQQNLCQIEATVMIQ